MKTRTLSVQLTSITSSEHVDADLCAAVTVAFLCSLSPQTTEPDLDDLPPCRPAALITSSEVTSRLVSASSRPHCAIRISLRRARFKGTDSGIAC